MSHDRLPPPDPPLCLIRCYPSSQKGGTLIAEDVVDRATHQRRLSDTDSYRPSRCPKCGHGALHVHDYPIRILLAEPVDAELPARVTKIVRYRCAGCDAIWRILPRFLARHLWRTWEVVELQTVSAPPPHDQPEVPKRTVRRWLARLRSAARTVMQALAAAAEATATRIAQALGLDATRSELVRMYADQAGSPRGRHLADLAALVHRLAPGLRLM